jgi:hypothetical protein
MEVVVGMDVQTVTMVVVAIGVLVAAVNRVYTSHRATAQRQQELETR